MATDNDEPDYGSILPGGEADTDKLAKKFMQAQIDALEQAAKWRKDPEGRGKSCTLCDAGCNAIKNAGGALTYFSSLIGPGIIFLAGDAIGCSPEEIATARSVLRQIAVKNTLRLAEQIEAEAAAEKAKAEKAEKAEGA